MNHDNEFDTLLDQALSEYREAEPLSGMEERILERVHRQSAPSRRRWYWAAATTAVAVLLVALWIAHPVPRVHVLPLDANLGPTARTESQVSAQPRGANLGHQRPEVAVHSIAKPPIAKLSLRHSKNVETQSAAVRLAPRVFPEPAPLNREERALLALAQRRPDLLRQTNGREKDQEIAISPIAIAPLAEHDGVQGEN